MTDLVDANVGAEVPAPITPVIEPVEPKMVSQDRVNELVQDAFNRGRAKGSTQRSQVDISSSFDPKALVNEAVQTAVAEIKKAAIEDAQQRQQTQAVDNLVNSLSKSMTDARGRISDYDQVVNSVDFGQFPEILEAIESTGAAGDLMYELAKNPAKIGVLVGLSRNSALAKSEAKKIAESIKVNREAQNIALPNEPLSQFKPSNSGIDKRPSTAEEWRKYFKGKVRGR